jgi:rSAM/selenodomain-associated transferase 2/rSAM/selenodomain-associated transferase 1
VQNSLTAQLSIIIPTLNEASHLPALLDDLNKQQGITFEIIIGDGGSSDATRTIVESSGALFVSTTKGRGLQMNAAASRAQSELLLFLHADSRMKYPKLLFDALQALTTEADWQERVAGHFCLRFIRSTSQNSLGYRYAEEKTTLNRVNTTNGDQGLLLSRHFFCQLGGFDETLPFLEDQRISENIRSQGKWITLPGYIETSARRFETEGFHRRYILMSMMMGLHSVGIDDFFRRAPEVYRVQQETGRLLLTPFFQLIRRMMRENWDFWGSIKVFYLLGRYIRQNSWQMFFFADVCFRSILGTGRYPFLTFHDRFVAPCTNFRLFNALTGLLCFIWYLCVLAPFFSIFDRGRKCVRSAVVLFVRNPVPGRVKTRLAREIGNENSCAFYRAMVQDALSAAAGSGAILKLFHDGVEKEELPQEWLNGVHDIFAQQGDSIGERMAAAFELLFSEGVERVALFGSDIPGIDADLLKRSLLSLETSDVSIVPAVDGGYCLIALNYKIFTKRIFQNIEWSSENVLSATLERCTECGLRVELLESRQDIDTLTDLLQYCQNTSVAAYASNAWLADAGYMNGNSIELC